MLVRVSIPKSKRGRALARKAPKLLTPEMRRVTTMWGRADSPGLAKVSTQYICRS